MPEERIRDGISQQMRLQAALQPDYVSVDERSLGDMLRFLYQYSAELRYVDENNKESGTWKDLFPQLANPDEILAFLKNPDSLPEDTARQYQQPHFVLLLTFLQLLERVKQHLNGFTKRHLDFYFQDILRMQKKKAVPDHVNVLIDLAKQQESFLLPAGTKLHAGNLLTYTTDEDTQLNHAKIAQLRAVYVGKNNLSIKEIYEANKEKSAEAILKMLAVVLGSVDHFTFDSITEAYKKGAVEAEFNISNEEFELLHCFSEEERVEKYELNLIYRILSSARKKKISKELAKVLALKEKDSAFIARRKRELQEDIVAEKEEWQGLYAIEDVRKTTVSNSVDAKDTAQGWKTFGQFSSNKGYSEKQDKQQHNPAEFGLAISSPVLMLSEGKRIIILTFQLKDNLILRPELFQVSLSTEDKWVQVQPRKICKKTWVIKFSANQEPIAAPKFGYFKGAKWPIVKIVFNDITIKKDSDKKEYNWMEHYQQLKFKSMVLSNVRISVSVTDFSDIKIWNDLQLLDNKKPFEPFGPKPIVGSRFYIAHPELSAKIISRLTCNITWANRKELLKKHYDNYKTEKYDPEIDKGDESFNISVGKNSIPSGKEKLFKDEIETSIEMKGIIEKPENICWELQKPDFQHSVYPSLAARKAAELAIELAKQSQDTDSIKILSQKIEKETNEVEKNKYIRELAAIVEKTTRADINDYFINPPFTPVIKKLTINYKASAKISDKQNDIKLFHIHPFGYAEITPVEDGEKIIGYPFLPQYDRAGELYIGLENLKPPQHLSVLFQMAEGSADANMPPSPVYWDYLDGNEWNPLENGGVLQDGTRGLINSGIIKFALPAPEDKKPSTLLPPELYWLRASVRKRPDSVCDTVAIHTQAVSATLVDNNNAPDHFRQPLAKETVKKLFYPLPAVKAVHQPYTSFGGKTAEEDKWFYTRVSERLRHKQRALTVWDYEHLVLERFPQIYKVKCIPANESRPGTVEIVVIPDIRNRLPADPFEPKAPVNLLEDIQHYLEGMAPDSANIVVRNARYVSFRVRMSVRFRQGYEEGHHINLLQDALNCFLAPWAYAKGEDIVFGGKIYASSIINFVERLPYVDYLAQLNFFPAELRLKDGENSISAKEGADVLVPEREHFIDAIPEGGYQFGINHMRIGLDFQVAENQ